MYPILKALFIIFILLLGHQIIAQSKTELDEEYIDETEELDGPDKVLHAEPLFIDLIRDLGARKGEHEWNIGLGLEDRLDFDEYITLIEYEFAPINRLGFEIELPFEWYSTNQDTGSPKPSNTLEGLQLATQWSFFVSEKISTSMALGYLHQFQTSSFDEFGDPLFTGNLFNPFFVIAKRWGNNWHTLIYTGPVIETEKEIDAEVSLEFNTNLHYMIPGTRNFIGVEFNKEVESDFDMVIRPQMRLEVTEDFMIGIVTGIPVSKENARFSSFLRVIWEP